MTIGLVTILLAGLAGPHVLRLDRVAPVTAIAIWLCALMLRALAAIFCALFFIVYLPGTELFTIISHWCLHEAVPFAAWHLGLDGHRLGDFALIAPAFVLVVSLLSVSVGIWRAARRVRHKLIRRSIGRGPNESLIVGDGHVFIAAAGLRRPEVIVSAGALTAFDDEELAASLEHERGHIARGHRFVLLVGELCRALGRFLPGTRKASQELVFHIERDADRFAAAKHEPLALAGAICKAANGAAIPLPAMALGGSSTVRRVKLLVTGLPKATTTGERGAKALAVALTILVLGSIATLPAAAHAGYHSSERRDLRHCAN